MLSALPALPFGRRPCVRTDRLDAPSPHRPWPPPTPLDELRSLLPNSRTQPLRPQHSPASREPGRAARSPPTAPRVLGGAEGGGGGPPPAFVVFLRWPPPPQPPTGGPDAAH